jgi:hypothetical protein
MGVALSLRSGKYILGRHQFDIHETGLSDSVYILSFQESPAYSGGP